MLTYLSKYLDATEISSLMKHFSPSLELPSFIESLQAFDRQLSEELALEPCPHCGSPVAKSFYFRVLKSIGGVKSKSLFYSLCCTKEGCRKRCRPPSLRWLGRSTTAIPLHMIAEFLMSQDKSPGDMLVELSQLVGVCCRTLFRWRQTWREKFCEKALWKNYIASYLASLGGGLVEHVKTITRTLVATLALRETSIALPPLTLFREYVTIFEELSPYLAGQHRQKNSRRVCQNQIE